MVREKSGNFALLKLWTPCLWLRGGGGGGGGGGSQGILLYSNCGHPAFGCAGGGGGGLIIEICSNCPCHQNSHQAHTVKSCINFLLRCHNEDLCCFVVSSILEFISPRE